MAGQVQPTSVILHLGEYFYARGQVAFDLSYLTIKFGDLFKLMPDMSVYEKKNLKNISRNSRFERSDELILCLRT